MEKKGSGYQECLAPGRWPGSRRFFAGPSASNACRFLKLNAPAYSLTDAPASLRRSLRLYLVISELFLAKVGLQYTVPSFDSSPYFVFREDGGAGGALATYFDDVMERGQHHAIPRTQTLLEARFGKLKL